MCGITGRVNFDIENRIHQEELKRMTDVLIHRGPDDEGFYMKQNVGLGFRRLSIIDLKTGHQPLSNDCKNIWIVFNGEIYNYLEEKEILLQKGYIFRTETDTEVILHLYEEYGVDCLDHLRGMFAFAIWDDYRKQLFCARDRFGIKPFYYYYDSSKFIFGSEIKSILASEEVDPSISDEALDSYFAFGYITGNLSIYKEIKKLPHGHFLLLSLKEFRNVKINSYYECRFEPDFTKTENQWQDEIQDCLTDTVKKHMISDVPLGAFLSGGIDSSSIIALMSRQSRPPVKTFTIGFKGSKDNEFRYARELSEKYGCEYHELSIDPQSIDLLPKLARAYDEPFADPSTIPTYYVSKFAKEYVTVALSGDGGDELFSGYDIFRYLHNVYKISSPFPSFNRKIWGTINKVIPQHMAGKGLTYFLSKNRNYLGAYLGYWTKDERDKLILHDRNKVNYQHGSELYKENILAYGKQNDFISNIQNLTMQTYMIDDVLTKVDRASMLNSLEVRVPLLDHKFVELTLKIPWDLKLKGKEQKYIFKKTMADYLTPGIMTHFKQGFGMPLSVWFRDDLRSYINETLVTCTPFLSDFLDIKYVRKLVAKNQTSTRDLGFKIWSLLIFEEWLNQRNKW